MRQHVSKALRIAVLGATGGTGRHVVTTAVERGHDVIALVRRAGSFEPGPRLTEEVWADLSDAYQIGTELPIRLWSSIGRADLAAFLVHEAETAQFVRAYPRIHQ
jgi:nucleoside-diphosphate-sugar epimerase